MSNVAPLRSENTNFSSLLLSFSVHLYCLIAFVRKQSANIQSRQSMKFLGVTNSYEQKITARK